MTDLDEATFEFNDPDTGQPWTARLIRQGDPFGLNLCLVHNHPDPTIAFYDRRYIDKFVTQNGGHRWGQFVSSYYVTTLFDQDEITSGVDLNAGIPTWSLSAAALRLVSDWLKGY